MRRGEPDGGLATSLLVDRPVEVEAVRTRVRDVVAGRPSLVLLTGVDGMGKSSFAELLRDSVRDEAEMLVTTCAGGPGYTAVRGLSEHAAGLLAEDVDDYTRLSRLTAAVLDLAARHPLVIVLDDAHRCDAASARWLGFLARRSADVPLCVVLTCPPTGCTSLETLFGDLIEVLDTSEIRVGPFSEEQVRELVFRRFGRVPAPEFVQACQEVCGGVPADLRRWLDDMAGQGVEPDSAGAEWLRDKGIASAVGRVWDRLAAQGSPVRQYATAVALIGSSGPDTAGALFGFSAAAVKAARTTLTDIGVLTAEGRFASRALRDRVLVELDPDELTALRTRAARMLRDEGASHADIADLLLALPELNEPWMVYTLREAARAVPAGADTAIALLRKAVAAVPDHVDTRLELADALVRTDPTAALAMYAEVVRDVPDGVTRASVVVRYGQVALDARRSHEAFPLLLGVLREAPPEDARLRALVEETLMVTGFHDVTTVRQALTFARDVTLSADLSAGENRRLVHQLASTELLTGGSVARVRELTELSMPPARGPYDFWDVLPAANLHLCGEPVEAMALLNRVVESAEVWDSRMTLALALNARAAMSFDGGDLAAAAADAERALNLDVPREMCAGDTWSRGLLAAVAVRRGANDRAAELLVEHTTPIEPIEHSWATAARARLLSNRGDLRTAVEMLLRCIRDFDEMGIASPLIVPWADAAKLLVELGREEEALDLVERFRPDRHGWDTAWVRGSALLVEGLATGKIETLEHAVSELAAAGVRLLECEALTALGLALLNAGQEKAARKHLRAAVDLAVRCGDVLAGNAARDALVKAGGRMGVLSATPLEALTGGERRVAELAAGKLTNREIADTLFVAVRTVESHLSNAYRKLGVQTRTELAARLR
ncbi:helix-turn-helix domain-containing protein [Lentzea sp. NEAU-D13]|uniref:Helix-turn-helix domain-containing protein n=1 Tax=Lentzea alba TaxID=2714351 RepID=A0A7C9W680_9PSEU|nr:LuxR family transcriptional regulator [Lentzea alba]NGY64220.1 helix-turn-helix domain-containing protein [Lentzea alba]